MSFYKEVPGRQTTLESTLKFDTEPKVGSTNPVTSEGVKSAIDGAVGYAAENLQEQINEIAEKAGSGYIPKGEASVATLNGLSGQENGDLYTMTDAGTLTDGSLAVVAGDTVAWDATNEVWYKAMDYAPSQYGTNEVHNLGTTITAFRTGDVIPVDGPSGTAKMSKDSLLLETAQNALAGNVAPAFDAARDNTNPYKAGESVTYNGKVYKFKVDHYGAWSASDVYADGDIANRLYGVEEDVNGHVYLYSLSGYTTGYYYDANGSLVSNWDSAYKEIVVGAEAEGQKLIIDVDPATTSDSRNYVVYDENNVKRFAVSNQTIHTTYNNHYESTTTLKTGWKIKASWKLSLNAPELWVLDATKVNLVRDVSELKNKVGSLDIEVNGDVEYDGVDLSSASSGSYYDIWGGLVTNADSKYIETTFSSSEDGRKLSIDVDSTTSASDGRYYLLLDNNGVIKDKITNGSIKNSHSSHYVFAYAVHNGWKLKASWSSLKNTPSINTIVSEVKSIEGKIESKYIIYVSTNGSDTNDGSEASPLKSVSRAVELGAETIILEDGVYEDNLLDLSKSIHDKITIKGRAQGDVIFKKSQAKVLADGSEQLVAGYTKVYSASVAAAPSFDGTKHWLFFDGLEDSDTSISLSDAHPLQRGRFYRCDCTKIVKTTADNLSDALDEIENSTEYKWWYDTGTHTLYFSRANSTSTYPIYRGKGASSDYLKTRNGQSVVLSNLEFRYSCVNLLNLNVAEIYNCSAKCVNAGGAFRYDESISLLFDHCEASLCYYSGNGDGFNGHAYARTNPFSKYCQVTLRECWSHDNNDDGYSDHEYSEATIDGGLYEWNKKGGVVPSYGSHCVCKNVLARNNYNGFYYAGVSDDDGNGGQLMCYACVSYGNNRASGRYGGFVADGPNNRVVLVGCKSISDKNGFICDSGSYMDLIDCGYSAVEVNAFSGAGTFTKIKTTIAE